VLVFALPVLLIVGVPELALWRIGESWPIERVIATQRRHPDVIWHRGLFDQEYHRYKYEYLKVAKPPIVALGSSRAMEFRSQMFGDHGGDFYAAGGALQRIEDLDELLKALPDYRPRVAILAVDVRWFNGPYVATLGPPGRFTFDIHYKPLSRWQAHITAVRMLLWSTRWPKVVWHARTQHPEHLGVPIPDVEGFRSDGSMKYRYRPTPGFPFINRQPFPLTKRIAQNTAEFVPTTQAATPQIDVLRSSIEELHRRGTLVLAFIPPYHSDVRRAIEANPTQRAFHVDFHERIDALAAELDVPLIDASDPTRLGADDRYLIDDSHGYETYELLVLREFVKDSRVAAALPGVQPVVDYAMASPRTNPWFPDYPPGSSR